MERKTVSFGFKQKNMEDVDKSLASQLLIDKGFDILRIGRFGISAKVPQDEITSLMQSPLENDKSDGDSTDDKNEKLDKVIEKSSFVSFTLSEDFQKYFNKAEMVLKDPELFEKIDKLKIKVGF